MGTATLTVPAGGGAPGGNDDALTAMVRRDLVRAAEPLGAAWRAALIPLDLAGMPLRPWAWWLLVPLIVLHAALPWLYLRRGGPWTRGGRWPLLDVAHATALVAVSVAVTMPGDWPLPGDRYIPHLGAFFPTLVLAAAYPYRSRALARHRLLAPAGVLLVEVVVALAGWVVSGPVLSAGRLQSVANTVLWSLVSAGFGLGLDRFVRVAVRQQTDTAQRSYEHSFNFLHTHVKAVLGTLRALHAGDDRTQVLLRDLEAKIAGHRVDLLLQHRLIDLATLVRERVRAVENVLDVAQLPPLGSVTLSQEDGRFIDRVLGDLLANCVRHGAQAVRIDADLSGELLALTVQDDGPGIAAGGPPNGSSLARLIADTEQAGGRLSISSPVPTQRGARVELAYPLRAPR